MYNFRRFLSITVVLFLMLHCFIPSAYAEGTEHVLSPEVLVSSRGVTISQKIGSSYSGKEVTILLVKQGSPVENITPALFLSNTEYGDQTTVRNDGSYEFRFSKPATGVYDLTMNIEGEKTAYTEEIIIYPNTTDSVELNLDVFGNIYYDYTNIPVKAFVAIAGEDTESEFNAKITLSEYNGSAVVGKSLADGEAFYTEEFPLEIGANGTLNATNILNLTGKNKQYGIFTLKYELYDGETKLAEDSTRIAVANTPKDGILNSKMGVGQHYTNDEKLQPYYGIGAIDEVEELYAKAGFSSTRGEITWHTFEKSKEDYKFTSQFENFYSAATENEKTPFLVLGKDNTLYSTGANASKVSNSAVLADHSDNDYLKAFGEYAYNAASETVKKLGVGNSYEIYNEYNIKQFKDGNVTPQTYVNLLKAAYEKIKLADSEAKVYGMATAHVINDSRSDYSTYKWLEEVLKTGAGYMDGISVHIYTQDSLPEDKKFKASKENTMVVASDKAAILAEYRRIVGMYMPKDTPIVISEMGYSSNETIATVDGDNSTPEVKQAKYSIRDFARLYDGAEKVIWYTGIEKPNISKYEHHLGLIRMENPWTGENDNGEVVTYTAEIPFEAKPVFLALSNWNALLSNAELISKQEGISLTSGNTGYNYKFRALDGDIVHVLWSSDDVNAGTINLDLGKKSVTRYDMYGNETVLASSNGKYSLSLTGEPIYIEVPADYKIELLDQNDNELYNSLSDTVSKVKARIITQAVPTDEVLILATYKEKALSNTIIRKISEIDTELVIDLNGADTVRAFLFNSMGTLTPLIEKRELK